MFCTNWPCLRIRSLPSSPLASTTGKTQQEPLSFTAKVAATGKQYWNGSIIQKESVLIFNFKGDWQQNRLKQGIAYTRFYLNWISSLTGTTITWSPGRGKNFYQLIKLWAADSDGLKKWLQQSRSYTSHEVQNEMLRIMAHQIQRPILRPW